MKWNFSGRLGQCEIALADFQSSLEKYCPDEQCLFIVDAQVLDLYPAYFPKNRTMEIHAGESMKTLDTIRDLYHRFLDHTADRQTLVVGVGGGVVCDIVGFAASTYLRGLPLGLVPTTLLAQVDASIGGKNGVNFAGYKNLVGLFRQPGFVIVDPAFLTSLPDLEYQNGLAEVVKHGAIANTPLFEFLEANAGKVLARDPDALKRIISDSISIKLSYVKVDEEEAGERRKLNFGHTFGHSLESVEGILHGQSVAWGMRLAARLSEKKGLLKTDDRLRIEKLLDALGLTVAPTVDSEKLIQAVAADKKRHEGLIRFIFLEGIGKAVDKKISLLELEQALDDLR